MIKGRTNGPFFCGVVRVERHPLPPHPDPSTQVKSG